MRHTYKMRWKRRNRDNLNSKLSLTRIFSLFLPPPLLKWLNSLLLIRGLSAWKILNPKRVKVNLK